MAFTHFQETVASMNNHQNVGFEALTAVVMKNTIFWDIMLCSLSKANQHFKGTYRFHLQGRRIGSACYELSHRFLAPLIL
jgi:hypothetical protein